MNVLPVGPEHVADAQARANYYADMERWGFDIAYSAYYAHPYDQVIGPLGEVYTQFAAEARKRGYASCIQIQSTVCAGDRVGIEEAQYDVSNNPERWGEHGFFASFASDAWLDYLRELTALFVRDHKFDYVVFEEPMYRVDIPGTQDRFHARFTAAYPDVKYPDVRTEGTAYLMVQRMKAKVLIDFYRELVAHARSVGARKVGIMPWFFIPTVENTPPGTLNTSCPIGRISEIPGLDFLVVRMQPDNVYCDVMRTGDDMRRSAKLYYFEVLAHALGKDLVAVNNPTDEHTNYPECPLIPFDFFRDATLSALAACPNGFSRHWYGQNYGKDEEHMNLLSAVMEHASELGRPQASVAFVFSYEGTRHAAPLTYETVFPHYWSLVKHMALKLHVPMLTFYADTLERDLAQHPEVQVLVLEEHFPLTTDQMTAISRWWQGPVKRAVVAFGAGLGYVADVESPGEHPCGRSFPGVLDLIGLRQEENPQIECDPPLLLHDVCRIRRSAFLGEQIGLQTGRVANVRRVFGSRAKVLYQAVIGDTQAPVVAEWRDRTTLALFCGFELSEGTDEAAARAVDYALKEVGAPPPLIQDCSDGIIWNANRNGYVVLCNLSDEVGTAVGRSGRANFWDCTGRRLFPDSEANFELPPHSFQVCRIVGRRSKFLGVKSAWYMRSLIDGTGRAEIELLAGRKTTFVLRASPREIYVDGRPSTITQEKVDGIFHVTLNQCPPGERKITLKW